jgi:hypothetical protein
VLGLLYLDLTFDMLKMEQAGLSGVIGALNLKMRLHTARRTGVAAFPKSGSGYALV